MTGKNEDKTPLGEQAGGHVAPAASEGAKSEETKKSFRRRIVAIAVVTGLLLLAFLLRLVQFQVVEGDAHREKAESAVSAARAATQEGRAAAPAAESDTSE